MFTDIGEDGPAEGASMLEVFCDFTGILRFSIGSSRARY